MKLFPQKKILLHHQPYNSLTEWQRFIGDALPYQKTCPDLPAPAKRTG